MRLEFARGLKERRTYIHMQNIMTFGGSSTDPDFLKQAENPGRAQEGMKLRCFRIGGCANRTAK